MNNNTNLLRVAWLFLLTLTLAACGFQPRGESPAPANALTPLAISGLDNDHPLYIAIAKRLPTSALTTDPGRAAAVLVITHVESRSELLTVDSRNKTSEQELIESFSYAIRKGDRESVPERLIAHRIHYTPGDAVLARAREAETLQDLMRQELADRLLRRLAAWH